MEVNKKSGSEEMLNRMWTLSAGLTAIALAVGLVVTIALKPPSQTGQFSAEMLYYAAMLAIAAGMGLCGFGLIRRRVWAQQTMLVFCLTVTAGAVVTLVSALIWEEWWTQTTTSTIGSGAAWMLMIGVLIGAVAMDAMLILASQWRLRYASIVSVSAAAAIALAVIVNVISQRDFHRVPVESLGRYSISERTERIISDLDEPIRLTCVYTGTSEGKRGAEFRPRLWELMEDIREKGYKLGKKIEIASVTTDAERRNIKLLSNFRSCGVTQRSGYTVLRRHIVFVAYYDIYQRPWMIEQSLSHSQCKSLSDFRIGILP